MPTLDERLSDLEATVRELRAENKRLQPKAPKYSRFVSIGDGSRIARDVNLWGSEGKEIRIGTSVNINRGAEILGPVTIGDNCLLSRDAYIRSGSIIGDHVALGPFVRLVTDTHQVGSARRRAGKATVEPIVIGDGAWIGAGTIILPGVTIGPGTIVGAGSVVTKDLPANCKAYGVPAKVIGILPEA